MTEQVKIEKGLGPDGRVAVVRFDRGDVLRIQLQDFLDGIQDNGIDKVIVLMNESISQAG